MNKEEFWKKAIEVWGIESIALKNLSNLIAKNEFVKVVEVLANCKGKIVTSGTGTSAVAAKKIAHSLSCIDKSSFFLSPSDAVHGALGSVQEGDIALLISKGGKTIEILNLITSLKAKKILIIGITENYNSTLALIKVYSGLIL